MNDMEKISRDLVYLAACGLHDRKPDEERIKQMDMPRLYGLSQFHSMTAIAAMALEAGGKLSEEIMPPALAQAWRERKNKSVRKNVLLETASAGLYGFMEQQKCWYMPLKGSVLKNLYPRAGMRQMADYDILYDREFQNAIRDHMVGAGYRAVSVGKGNHDVYEKPPIYNFELHTSLFGAAHRGCWAAYYGDVRERLILTEGTACRYHFTDEDFYLYMMVHACKHHDGGGTGLRSLMDTYVYLWKKGDGLDWDYVEAEAKKLEIAEFEAGCRSLSRKLFADPVEGYACELSEAEMDFLMDFAGAGTYGTTEKRVNKKLHALEQNQGSIRGKTKWKYLLRRVFPDLEWFRVNYPAAYEHRVLIPFFCLFRILRGVLCSGNRVRAELKAIRSAK